MYKLPSFPRNSVRAKLRGDTSGGV